MASWMTPSATAAPAPHLETHPPLQPAPLTAPPPPSTAIDTDALAALDRGPGKEDPAPASHRSQDQQRDSVSAGAAGLRELLWEATRREDALAEKVRDLEEQLQHEDAMLSETEVQLREYVQVGLASTASKGRQEETRSHKEQIPKLLI
jgi:hypothetical protein